MPIINIARNEEEAYQNGTNPRPIDYQGEKLWLYDTHVGLCIKDFESNGYDDSDFNMIVWNTEKDEPEIICFASTRYWSYPCYSSSPDATPEILQKYAAWQEKKRIIKEEQERIEQLNKPSIGKEIEIDGGRKYKGKSGRIFWLGTNKYNGEKTAGIETATGEKFFIPTSYIKAIA